MKVIVFLAILGLSLAGFRGVPQQLSSFLGAIQGAVQGAVATATAEAQGTVQTIASDAQGTAATAAADIQGTVNNVVSEAQGTAGAIAQNLPGAISATEGSITYAQQHLNTTQIIKDVGEAATLTGTALTTAGDIAKIINAGAQIAGDSFVNTGALVQAGVETASSDIQGAVANAGTAIQGAVQNVEGATGAGINALGSAVQSINEPEVIQGINEAATDIGTVLPIANSILGDVNDGLSIFGGI